MPISTIIILMQIGCLVAVICTTGSLIASLRRHNKAMKALREALMEQIKMEGNGVDPN